MAELRFHPRARVDLDAIWSYTVHKQGRPKARLYLERLIETCVELAEMPDQGTRRDDIGRDVQAYVAGQHHVFYRTVEAGIDVVRVLPARMDVVRHTDC